MKLKAIFLNYSNTFTIFDQPCSEERLNYLFIMTAENHCHMKKTKNPQPNVRKVYRSMARSESKLCV